MQSSNAASRVIFSETNGHEFKREHMSIEVAVSGLAALLQKHEVPTMRIKIFGAPSSERNQALDLEIPTDANFVTVIAQVLGQSPGVAPSDPSAYQMLMADPDGDPDEELIPPRDKPVADLDWRDFALLPAPPHLAAAQEKSDRLIGNGHSMGGKAAGSEGGACSIRGGSSESVGFGHGKAREVPEAIRKATEAAKRGLIRVSLREGRTLHHDVNGRHGAGKVILRAAPQGTGIIAGGPMRAVFETLGMQDVVAKSLGSSNPYNLVRATFEALKNEDSPRSVAARRGIKVSTLQSRRRDADPADQSEAAVA